MSSSVVFQMHSVLCFLLLFLRPRERLRSIVTSASVCVSLCLSVCPTGYLRNSMRDLYQIFVHGAYGCGSVLLRHVDDRLHRLSREGVFFPPLKMHYNALAAKVTIRLAVTPCSTRNHSVAAEFAENGISRKGGDGCTQRGRIVIYDCLVLSWISLLVVGLFCRFCEFCVYLPLVVISLICLYQGRIEGTVIYPPPPVYHAKGAFTSPRQKRADLD